MNSFMEKENIGKSWFTIKHKLYSGMWIITIYCH